MKLICVCVTRNRGTGSKSDGSSFLLNALRSYEATIGCPAMLYVIDDASTDDTSPDHTEPVYDEWLNSAASWRCRPIVIHNPRQLGIGGSMNQWIMPRLDDDDDIVVRFDDDILFKNPGWGQRILDTFAVAPPELVSLGGRQIDPRGWIICFGDRLIGPRYRHYFERIHRKAMQPLEDPHIVFPVHSVMGAFGAFRASALKAIGGYDPRFAKLRCETEDVHCSFLARGWNAGVRFGLDITHWSDPTYEHTAPDKAWGCTRLNETWFEKWGFHRTGLANDNSFDPKLAALRRQQIQEHAKYRLVERLTDCDFDEVPGIMGQYTSCRLPKPGDLARESGSRPGGRSDSVHAANVHDEVLG